MPRARGSYSYIRATRSAITTILRSTASVPLERLQFIQRPRPIGAQQSRQRTIGENLASGLALGAVVGLIIGIADALHRLAASRARQPVATVDRHADAKRGHFLRKPFGRL